MCQLDGLIDGDVEDVDSEEKETDEFKVNVVGYSIHHVIRETLGRRQSPYCHRRFNRKRVNTLL